MQHELRGLLRERKDPQGQTDTHALWELTLIFSAMQTKHHTTSPLVQRIDPERGRDAFV